ncbi:MAG TPA: GGDEF domain-containing protein [Rhodanobacter sp.]
MWTSKLLCRSAHLAEENECLRAELTHARTQVRALLGLATTDELTGLLNRRGFLRVAEAELRRAQVAQHPITLIYVDVDGLKALNDEAGHQAGDALLVETAALLRAAFRPTDVLARLGGDEFVVLTNTFHGTGAIIRHRIARLSQALHRSGAQSREISLSAGVVLATPSSVPALDELLDRADQAMYQIKYSKSTAYSGRRYLPSRALSMAV